MSSRRLRQLTTRLEELRAHFLPREFSPTGTYQAEEVDRTRAFRLLAHAEIEAFLEELALNTVDEICDAWFKARVGGNPLLALITYFGKVPAAIPQNVAELIKARPFDVIIEGAKASYSEYVVMQNNGIREKQVIKLLVPAGIREGELDRAWLSTLDAFGAARGETAHRASARTTTLPDPRSDFETVEQILAGLRDVDKMLADVRARAKRIQTAAARKPTLPGEPS